MLFLQIVRTFRNVIFLFFCFSTSDIVKGYRTSSTIYLRMHEQMQIPNKHVSSGAAVRTYTNKSLNKCDNATIIIIYMPHFILRTYYFTLTTSFNLKKNNNNNTHTVKNTVFAWNVFPFHACRAYSNGMHVGPWKRSRNIPLNYAIDHARLCYWLKSYVGIRVR